jgi:hypothetical protein
MMMAGMIGAGSLVWAIEWWIEGFEPGWLNEQSSFVVSAYSFLIAIGLVLVAIESAKSGRPKAAAFSEETPGMAASSEYLQTEPELLCS